MPGKTSHVFYGRVGKTLLKVCLPLISLMAAAFAFSFPTTAATQADTFDLQVDIGFHSVLKQGAWMPVLASVTNHGKSDFSGSVMAETYNGNTNGAGQNMAASPQSFSTPIKLAAGKRLQTTIYVPLSVDPLLPGGIIVELVDGHNQILRTRTKMVNPPDQSTVTIGILSDQQKGFDVLKSLNLPSQQTPVDFTFLNASTLPTRTTVLNNFDMIVLDNFSTSSLRSEQINALRTWVNQGGALLEIGGIDWQRTLGPLPAEIRPVTLDGSFELPSRTRLFLQENSGTGSNGSSNGALGPGSKVKTTATKTDELPVPVTASMATAQSDSAANSTLAVLSDYNDSPLFMQTRQGRGTISYLAFDPASLALDKWAGKSNLWTQLLTHALGDRLLIANGAQKYSNGQGGLLTRGGVLPSLEPNFSFAPITFLFLLLGYVAFLGPVRLLFMKRLRHPAWSWRIVLSGMVIFTLVSYGIAFYQKNASLTNNSFSIMQLNESGSEAHVTTYMGVFVPNKGSFNVHIPGTSQVLAVADPQMALNAYGTDTDPGASISYGASETNVNLEALDTWTYHPMVIEQDRHVTGNVDVQLKLQGENLIGTITNHLTTAVNDMYVLLPHNFVAIGRLGAGEKRTIFLPLRSNTTNPDTLLADQLARSRGLPSSYFPYANQGQPQNDLQRHMAQLSVLSGAGSSFIPCEGSCPARAILNNQSVIISSHARRANPVMLRENDPLLIENAPATLIGWPEQSLDDSSDITINGGHPGGYHDTLLQMPITLHLAAPFRLPDTYISGHAVSTQDSDVALVAPNLYTISRGSIEFEFDFPRKLNSSVQMLSVAIPHAINGKIFPPAYGYLQASLYDWKSNAWDKFSLYPDSLNTINPDNYLGQNGNLLLQITDANNAKPSFSPIYFNRPYLNLV
ncbi:MAG: hypothetical protein H0U76_07925 [Ktedonobacteraceae bacterium]|nr:hypothetical protein [Ktedonobacteraceae bacterium]